MRNSIIQDFEDRVFGQVTRPDFRAGDTVKVHYKIPESADKEKFRIQIFQGIVIRYKKGGVAASFTVRKIAANGVGVERIFPLFSPYIEQIEVTARGIVRRARLYYLRNLAGKAARVKTRYTSVAKKISKSSS